MKSPLSLLFVAFFAFNSFSQIIALEQYATGFSSPVDITNAGDDRLFIVERGGEIKIIDGTGTTLSTPFLDIDNIVHNASFQSEQGLLGLAFHPNYADNGYFFVNYTDNDDNTVIARYTRDASDSNIADPNSAQIILTIDQPANNHNGGGIKFGPDGYLYIGMGDGGSGNDPFGAFGNGQNKLTMLGKMLRIDIDNGLPYTIPTDNPFANDDFVLDEIWAIGLRNPWRFSFDRVTGDLWIGDVGQNAWEEIDFQPASSTGGENYGWRCYEGNHFTNLTSAGNCSENYVAPAFEVQQGGSGGPCSITGGYVYRGSEFPSLVGKYIFADYCSGEFFIIEPDGSGGWVGMEVDDFNYDISTFGEDANGELYCARLGNGRIYKITADACAGFSATTNVTAEPCEGGLGGVAEITAASGTPPYTYSPNLDFSNLAADTYTVTVTDNAGCATSTTFTVNSLPLPAVPTFTVNDNNLTAPSGFSGYQWFLNGQAIAGATMETYTIIESGNYSVEVMGANGCSNVSTETNVTYTTSLESIPSLEEFSVTPNPFDKDIFVEIFVNEATKLDMEILDVTGKKVFSKTVTINEKYTQSIELQTLSTGVYYLNLKSINGVVVKKIVKK